MTTAKTLALLAIACIRVALGQQPVRRDLAAWVS